MEDYYDFSFDDPLNPSLPWYNDTCYNATNPFVFIEKETSFNPDYKGLFKGTFIQKFRPLSITYFLLKWAIIRARLFIWHFFPLCMGLIKYDFNNHTYNMELNSDFRLPIININGTEGWPINNSPDNYEIKFHIE
jgi:hypothetical protein